MTGTDLLIKNCSPEEVEYLTEKGAELFYRRTAGTCSAITKHAIDAVPEDRRDEMRQIASSVFNQYGLQMDIEDLRDNLHNQHLNMMDLHREMRAMERDQNYQSDLLNGALDDISILFNSVDDIQDSLDKNKAFSIGVFRFAKAEVKSLSEKLSLVDKKLSNASEQIESVKRVEFERQIAAPYRDICWTYKTIVDQIVRGKDLSESEMIKEIKDCNNLIISLFSLRDEFPRTVIIDLLLDLMRVFTSLIVNYYRNFYDTEQKRNPLHEEWMSVYDRFLQRDFNEYFKDYLLLDKDLTNRQMYEFLDQMHLRIMQTKKSIDKELAVLDDCKDVKKNKLIEEKSDAAIGQVLMEIESKAKDTFGEVETEEYFAPVKRVFQYANDI